MKELNKVDPFGIKNVCFSVANSNEHKKKDIKKWAKQRLERGFDDTELWDLSSVLMLFLLPRLKEFIKQQGDGVPNSIYERYKEEKDGYNKARKEWKNTLKEILWLVKEHVTEAESQKIYKKYKPIMIKVSDGFTFKYKSKKEEEQYLSEMRRLSERMNDARILLGEHIFDLWS